MLRIDGDSTTGGATISVRKTQGGRIELFVDCDRPQALGDGTTVVSSTLPPGKARELLAKLVQETPWLQEALAMQRIDQLLSEGTGPVGW
ncbi:hypothetical protein ACWGIU_15515 [Streptomyces sp. NPDC054840]|uniref:hypothetical protein n=1 Tax=Streptomyces sp. NPDC001549 TaxID=3364586 RepID=UPI003698BC94